MAPSVLTCNARTGSLLTDGRTDGLWVGHGLHNGGPTSKRAFIREGFLQQKNPAAKKNAPCVAPPSRRPRHARNAGAVRGRGGRVKKLAPATNALRSLLQFSLLLFLPTRFPSPHSLDLPLSLSPRPSDRSIHCNLHYTRSLDRSWLASCSNTLSLLAAG